jgi:hypothetical protein
MKEKVDFGAEDGRKHDTVVHSHIKGWEMMEEDIH